jgi:hypothetical protein
MLSKGTARGARALIYGTGSMGAPSPPSGMQTVWADKGCNQNHAHANGGTVPVIPAAGNSPRAVPAHAVQ